MKVSPLIQGRAIVKEFVATGLQKVSVQLEDDLRTANAFAIIAARPFSP
jgi:hypothetical protein